MEHILDNLTPWFQWLTRSSVQVSVLVIMILAIKFLLRGKLAPRWHYCLWLLVVARMVMPSAPQSSLSIFNLIPKADQPTEIIKQADETITPSQSVTEFDTDYTPPATIELSIPPITSPQPNAESTFLSSLK